MINYEYFKYLIMNKQICKNMLNSESRERERERVNSARKFLIHISQIPTQF